MIENLISEGIGVLVELVLVYFVITIVLDNREKKKWEPVKKLVVKRTYSVAHGLQASLLQILKQYPDSIQNSGHYLKKISYDMEKLKNLIDLNGVGLGSSILPELMQLIEEFELLQTHIQYLVQVHVKNPKEYDFCTQSPIDALKKMDSTLNSLLLKASVKVDDPRPDVVSLNHISDTWSSFTEKRNIFEPFGSKKLDGTKKVFAFNIETLKNIPIDPQILDEKDVPVVVFDNFN